MTAVMAAQEATEAPPIHCAALLWNDAITAGGPLRPGDRIEMRAQIVWGTLTPTPGGAHRPGNTVTGFWHANPGTDRQVVPEPILATLRPIARAPQGETAGPTDVWTPQQIHALLSDPDLICVLAAEQISVLAHKTLRRKRLSLTDPELTHSGATLQVIFVCTPPPPGVPDLQALALSAGMAIATAAFTVGRDLTQALREPSLTSALLLALTLLAITAFIVYATPRLRAEFTAEPLYRPTHPPSVDTGRTDTPSPALNAELQLGAERLARLEALHAQTVDHPSAQAHPQRLHTLRQRLEQGISAQQRALALAQTERHSVKLEELERDSDAELLLLGIAPTAHLQRALTITLDAAAQDAAAQDTDHGGPP